MRRMVISGVLGVTMIGAAGGCGGQDASAKEDQAKSKVVAPPVEYFDQKVERPAQAPASEALQRPDDVTMGQPPKVEVVDHASPESDDAKPRQAAALDDAAKTARFLGLTAPKPAEWLDQPSRGDMYKASYTVPGVDGEEAAQIVVFHFGASDRGTKEDNINRWVGQFKGPDDGAVTPTITEFVSDEMPITLVELEGAYRGMGDTYRPGQKFMSAIVEAPAGKIYIRFVGLAKTVEANREAYLTMLRGLRRLDMSK